MTLTAARYCAVRISYLIDSTICRYSLEFISMVFPPVPYDLHPGVYLSIPDIFPSVERRNPSFHNYMYLAIKHRYQLNFVLFSDSFSKSILNSGAIHEANSPAIIG